MDHYLEIPTERLTAEALQAVIEDYITREGTDYGHQDFTLEQKVAQIQQQLQSGSAVIAYDTETETCTLLTKN